MDAETREMLQAIQAQISGLRSEVSSELRTEIGGLREELRSELRIEMGGLRDELRSELRAEIGGLRAEMRGGDEMTRRHFDVLAESLRADIRTVAEGAAANTDLTLRLHHELKSEMDSRFRSLETVLHVTFADLRRAIDGLRSDN